MLDWSYEPALPTAKDKVRLLIGDTVSTDPQLSDPEIQFSVDRNGSNVYSAAVECCRVLAARYARQVDKQVGSTKISASQRSKAYTALAVQLSQQAASVNGRPSAGGIYATEKETMASNETLVHGQLSIGIHDFK